MDLEKSVYLADLFDIYGSLLTNKQQKYFTDYYLADLSIREIANIYDVSANAIFDQLKHAQNKLIELENKLKFYNKMDKINDLDIPKNYKENILDILKE